MDMNAVATTPLNAWHRAHDGKMVDFAGWDMPVQYADGILREHLATRKFAGLFDVSHMGRFILRGRDTLPFLQWTLTNNAAALEPWRAQYTLIPNATGGLLDDAYLYRFGDDDYWLVVNASNREKDWAHLLEQTKKFKDVALEDHTTDMAMIALQGPLAKQILEPLVEQGQIPQPFRNSLSEVTIMGTPVRLARTGYTGEPIAFELFVPSDRVEAIWERIHADGHPLGLRAAGLGARDTLRLEAGLPLYGHEFGTDTENREIPAYAVPLAAVAVSFSEHKGPFIGQKALAAQFEETKKLKEGHPTDPAILPRRFKPLALLDKGVIRQGDEVWLDDRKIGTVSSGTTVPYWIFEGDGAAASIGERSERRAIALAYLDAAIPADKDVDVRVRGKRLKARTVRWHGRSEAPPWFRAIQVGEARPTRPSATGEGIKKMRILLEKSLDNHDWRRARCMNLIASENTPSPLVRLLQVSDPVGRYAEHKEMPAAFDQEVFYYQGTDFIEWVELQLTAELSAFMGCPQVETRAISGQMANMIIFSALMDHKNRLNRRSEPERIRLAMNNHIGSGGHLSAQPMGALRDYIAKDPVTERFAVVNLPHCRDNPFRIDIEETGKLLDTVNPEIIILGKSMVLHPEPVAAIRAMVEDRDPRPLIMVDMAHVLGLIGPHFQKPFEEGADVVTGSTHKTFFGSQRGAIGANFDEQTPWFDLWKAIRRRAFPGMVSNHHLGSLLGLLAAAIEMNAFKDTYQPQVMANAKALGRALAEQGLDVQGDPDVDYTETHQIIVKAGWAQGCRMARNLEKNNIIVNYQAIPSDESFTVSSALRLGVAEMTRFGMKEKDFAAFAPIFADAMKDKPGVGDEVVRFRAPFQTLSYCFDGPDIDAVKARLLNTF